jgi:hypothetical protein
VFPTRHARRARDEVLKLVCVTQSGRADAVSPTQGLGRVSCCRRHSSWAQTAVPDGLRPYRWSTCAPALGAACSWYRGTDSRSQQRRRGRHLRRRRVYLAAVIASAVISPRSAVPSRINVGRSASPSDDGSRSKLSSIGLFSPSVRACAGVPRSRQIRQQVRITHGLHGQMQSHGLHENDTCAPRGAKRPLCACRQYLVISATLSAFRLAACAIGSRRTESEPSAGG